MVTWEFEGTNPLRCEGVETDPGTMSDDSKKESVDQKPILLKFSENRNMTRVACFAKKIFTCASSKRKNPAGRARVG